MNKRIAKIFARVLGGVVIGLAAIGMLLLWRLATGPVSLSFLTPYLEESLNQMAAPLSLRVGDTVLSWEGWRRNLDIQMINILAADASGKALLSIPRASVTLSGRALLAGTLAPQTVELQSLSLEITRNANGDWSLDLGERDLRIDRSNSREQLMAFLKQAQNTDQPLSYLKQVTLNNARLTMDDQFTGKVWTVPSMGLMMERNKEDLNLSAAITLITKETPPTHLELQGHLSVPSGEIVGNLMVDHLPTVLLADFWPPAAPLTAWTVPLSATGALVMDLDGDVKRLAFDLDSQGSGEVQLPLPFEQNVSVSEFRANGHYDGATALWTVPEIVVRFLPNTHLLMPPMSHPLPLQAISASLDYDSAVSRLAVSELDLDLGGALLSVEGELEGVGAAQTAIRMAGRLTDVQTDRLGTLWPMGWGEDTRRWVLTNISGGAVPEAWTEIIANIGKNGDFDLFEIRGEIDIDNVSVAYLAPMPPVQNASGRANFSKDKFEITIDSGHHGALTVTSGQLNFGGLSEPDQTAEIALDIEGPLREGLILIDQQPLALVSEIGLSPDLVEGDAMLHLELAFPVEKTLRPDQIEVSAQAKMSGIRSDEVYRDLDLSNGLFDLTIDTDGMEVTGEAVLGSIPVSLQWRENFSETAAFMSRYHLLGSLNEDQRRNELGLDFAPFSPDFIRGPMATDLLVTLANDGAVDFQADLDLTELDITIAPLGWDKEAGVTGRAQVIGKSADGKITDLSKIQVRAADLAADGTLRFDPVSTTLRQISVSRLSYGDSEMAAVFNAQEGGSWEGTLKGKRLNAKPLIETLAKEPDPSADELGKLPPIALSAQFDRINLVPEHGLNNPSGILTYDGEKWAQVLLQSEVGDQNTPLLISVKKEGRKRALEVVSGDAGAALRALGLYDNMDGGDLKITGQFHDDLKDSPLSGEVIVTDFRVKEAPTLVRLVSLVSLTGVLEALQNPEGLGFSRLDAAYLYRGDSIEFKKARVAGLSLGATANGVLNMKSDEIDLEGTLVPAYVLNSLLGNLPIVGQLLSGGEEGGGVFAANFRIRGPTAEPKVSVNPLSTLAPGVMRNLFDIFGDGSSKGQPPEEAGGEGQVDAPEQEPTTSPSP